ERRADRLDLVIRSAGLLPGGHPVPATGLKLAAELGLELSQHVSRQIAPSDLTTADVVIGMSREHVREVLAVDPTLWPRVFTLKQFARWLSEHPRPSGVPLRPWLDEVAAARPRDEAIGADPGDDIADPIASPMRAWRAMAAQVDTALVTMFDGLRAGDAREGLPDR
ncbi:MAG TPA: hypothetical protein VGC18_12180, partial [Lacisediminihabitans sp.]|uniref:arsenate reductase/protein-tyrosine-phosphatase family protein n=1 Tax=Lacisediminihabitans sp. TaxID=2787631 RepID=UPI002EDA91AF